MDPKIAAGQNNKTTTTATGACFTNGCVTVLCCGSLLRSGNNISIASNSIVEQYGFNNVQLGYILSALLAGYESIYRLRNPQPIDHLWVVVLAAIIGFAGNEAVAILRIRVGKQINSAALVADGYHARVDGLTSLAVLFSAVAVWLGYPLADPIVGLVITVAILAIVWESGKTVFTRLLDGVDPEVTYEITHALNHAQGVRDVTEIRLRWSGHRLHAEINLAVSPKLSVAEGHAIAVEARHQLMHSLPYLSNVTVHVDPEDLSGEKHHGFTEQTTMASR